MTAQGESRTFTKYLTSCFSLPSSPTRAGVFVELQVLSLLEARVRLGCNLRESDLPAPVSCSQNHLKSHRLAADFAFTAEAKIESKQHHESQFTIPRFKAKTDCHRLSHAAGMGAEAAGGLGSQSSPDSRSFVEPGVIRHALLCLMKR